ncbi:MULTISPECIES: S66 family peptidase [Mammaliicoccus]|uniref:S66 family peptidase n=1 Tax=Mammaliicoccus TaxID=2803850 RepID=UPI000D1EE100|nr:S66 peptidase family protein [Mammaliicoccus sciuri]MCE4979615.1 LD-carboxypeptidase [Mammaliicoccus sciuri]MCE5056917.1 LD-carboxypeptidase [Mammaliicoccus sciuri]MCE5084408.1 LD-carboxypeptidase [Mammaliicoccus sciuri]MCE5094120.1 LD-carboxypeptidase [Mammaliicoccus sciuri]MDT0668884.1 LD-carboxypeptidase [Mammaliicoccus sciuri]
MKELIKPSKLSKGDTVAIVSPSSGLAGEKDILWRTEVGIQRLKDEFGLNVKVMPHALKGADYTYNHPEKRVEDLHQALQDPEVKAIICTLGGDDSVRLWPYIDLNIIKDNPKIFSGYSDTTALHFMFYQAGVSSFYGPLLLTDFAENVQMDDYTVQSINQTWFQNGVVGNVPTSSQIRKYGLQWDEKNKNINRESFDNNGYEILNGSGKATGHLIGGCMELFHSLKATDVFPNKDVFDGAILFIETAEVHAPPWLMEDYVRAFGSMGIFDRINGVIIGRPQDDVYYEEYKEVWVKMLKEWHQEDMPVFYNASFGHNEPKCIIPYGAQAELDVDNKTFTIIDNAVD